MDALFRMVLRQGLALALGGLMRMQDGGILPHD
jgi:hypothetical protein